MQVGLGPSCSLEPSSFLALLSVDWHMGWDGLLPDYQAQGLLTERGWSLKWTLVTRCCELWAMEHVPWMVVLLLAFLVMCIYCWMGWRVGDNSSGMCLMASTTNALSPRGCFNDGGTNGLVGGALIKGIRPRRGVCQAWLHCHAVCDLLFYGCRFCKHDNWF